MEQNKVLKEELNAALERITNLEDYFRRKKNVTVYSAPEQEDKDCIEFAKSLVAALGNDKDDVPVHDAYRVGAQRNARPRPIIIRFVNRQDKKHLWDDK